MTDGLTATARRAAPIAPVAVREPLRGDGVGGVGCPGVPEGPARRSTGPPGTGPARGVAWSGRAAPLPASYAVPLTASLGAGRGARTPASGPTGP